MALTKEQIDSLHTIGFSIDKSWNDAADIRVGKLIVQVQDYGFQRKLYVSLYRHDQIIHSQEFDDDNFDQALSFAIRLRDIYQEAQTKYEELVKEFNTK